MGVKEKLLDVSGATAEELRGRAFEVICENLMESSEEILSLIGISAPGVGRIVLSYKQRRQERMLALFMEEVREKLELLNERLALLSAEAFQTFRENYFGFVTDYVLDEQQEDKIQYLVTGLINLAGMDHVNEDFVLTYYDTLRDLRIRDIAILKFYRDLTRYNLEVRPTVLDVLQSLNLDYTQYEAIREKLFRMGLLTSKREQQEDRVIENLLNIQNYVDDLNRGKKMKLKSFKKVDKNDSYQLSKYGREFLEFFMTLETTDENC